MNSDTETVEIQSPAYLNDTKVLMYLEKTDADLSRMVLEDGRLWAYSKKKPDQLCRQCLEDMVALAFPAYFETSKPSDTVVPVVEPEAHPKGLPLGSAEFLARLTPEVRAIKARPISEGHKGTLPSIRMPNGKDVVATKVIQLSSVSVKVPVVDEARELLGYAKVPRGDYEALRFCRDRPDTLMWTLDAGRNVVCRVKGNPAAPGTQRVNDLMGEIGLRSFVDFQPLVVKLQPKVHA